MTAQVEGQVEYLCAQRGGFSAFSSGGQSWKQSFTMPSAPTAPTRRATRPVVAQQDADKKLHLEWLSQQPITIIQPWTRDELYD